MPSAFSQAFPPAPKFTEKNVGSLRGKVRRSYHGFCEPPRGLMF